MFPIGPHCAPLERSRSPRTALRLTRIAAIVLAWLPAAGAVAQQNLGFELLDTQGRPLGWTVSAGGADVASDGAAAQGEHSLRVTRAAGGGITRVTQRVAAEALWTRGATARTARLRLTGLVRTAAAGVTPSLWLRVDGPRGPLFLDSGGFSRESSAETDGGVVLPAGGSDWRRYELELPLPADVEDVAFGIGLRGEGRAWFDSLTLRVIVTDAWPAAAPAAVRYVEAALALMRGHSLRRAEVDWPALRAQALAHARGATTAADAHLAVRFALRELGDRHSYLQSAATTRALATAAVSNARTGSPPAMPRALRLADGIAYLQVPGFAGGTPLQQVEFAETLKSAIQAADEAGACGWAVDLRQNTGGNLWPMLAGLGPLLGDGELAASVYPDGRRVAVWHRDGQAGFGEYTQLRVRSPYRAVAAPVAVLLGERTASSAEVLAVAFRGRAATRSFGAPTRGLSAGNRTFALADGASLVLTVAGTADTAGRLYLGPVAPDEPVARAAESPGTGEPPDAALEAAVAWLLAGDSCG